MLAKSCRYQNMRQFAKLRGPWHSQQASLQLLLFTQSQVKEH